MFLVEVTVNGAPSNLPTGVKLHDIYDSDATFKVAARDAKHAACRVAEIDEVVLEQLIAVAPASKPGFPKFFRYDFRHDEVVEDTDL